MVIILFIVLMLIGLMILKDRVLFLMNLSGIVILVMVGCMVVEKKDRFVVCRSCLYVLDILGSRLVFGYLVFS